MRAISLLLLLACTAPAALSDKSPLEFRGTEYLPRWSKNNQHEFTPAGQEDLEKWTDMITINLYPKVKTGEDLAEATNAVLQNYEKARAMVIRTDSVPRTDNAEAEHLIVVLFPRPDFIEAAFARFKLIDGTGISAVYSHRVYGKAAGDEMSAWLEANGPAVEKALMKWRCVPAPGR